MTNLSRMIQILAIVCLGLFSKAEAQGTHMGMEFLVQFPYMPEGQPILMMYSTMLDSFDVYVTAPLSIQAVFKRIHLKRFEVSSYTVQQRYLALASGSTSSIVAKGKLDFGMTVFLAISLHSAASFQAIPSAGWGVEYFVLVPKKEAFIKQKCTGRTVGELPVGDDDHDSWEDEDIASYTRTNLEGISLPIPPQVPPFVAGFLPQGLEHDGLNLLKFEPDCEQSITLGMTTSFFYYELQVDLNANDQCYALYFDYCNGDENECQKLEGWATGCAFPSVCGSNFIWYTEIRTHPLEAYCNPWTDIDYKVVAVPTRTFKSVNFRFRTRLASDFSASNKSAIYRLSTAFVKQDAWEHAALMILLGHSKMIQLLIMLHYVATKSEAQKVSFNCSCDKEMKNIAEMCDRFIKIQESNLQECRTERLQAVEKHQNDLRVSQKRSMPEDSITFFYSTLVYFISFIMIIIALLLGFLVCYYNRANVSINENLHLKDRITRLEKMLLTKEY